MRRDGRDGLGIPSKYILWDAHTKLSTPCSENGWGSGGVGCQPSKRAAGSWIANDDVSPAHQPQWMIGAICPHGGKVRIVSERHTVEFSGLGGLLRQSKCTEGASFRLGCAQLGRYAHLLKPAFLVRDSQQNPSLPLHSTRRLHLPARKTPYQSPTSCISSRRRLLHLPSRRFEYILKPRTRCFDSGVPSVAGRNTALPAVRGGEGGGAGWSWLAHITSCLPSATSPAPPACRAAAAAWLPESILSQGNRIQTPTSWAGPSLPKLRRPRRTLQDVPRLRLWILCAPIVHV